MRLSEPPRTVYRRTDCQSNRRKPAGIFMTRHERIEVNPAIMFGKPVIKGTRITVEQILRKLASGMTPGQILEDHPRLAIAAIQAADAFAAEYLAGEEVAFGWAS
jgi:uncharacterized protein (DUF433 family)